MLELLKKSLLAGIGMVALTGEKIQEVTRSLVDEGKLSTEEAEKLAEDLVKSGKHEWEEINAHLSDTMKKWSESLDIVRKGELAELKARVEILEQRIELLDGSRKKEEEAPGSN